MNKILLHPINLTLVFVLTLSTAYSQVSRKGNWTEEDLNYVRTEMEAGRAELGTFLDEERIDPFIDCLVIKIETNFENVEELDSNELKVQNITVDCLNEVGFMDQKKSEFESRSWPEEDKEELRKNFEYMRRSMSDLMDSTQVDALYDCILGKLELRFERYDPTSDELINYTEKYTQNCIVELGVFDEEDDINSQNTSTKGNWSKNDKQRLKEELNSLRSSVVEQFGEEKTDLLFNCYSEAIQREYNNFDEADKAENKERNSKLVEQCMEVSNE